MTAGTVMHRTKLPLRTWFWAAYLVATHHPGSAPSSCNASSGEFFLGGYEEGLKAGASAARRHSSPSRSRPADVGLAASGWLS